jgi:GTP-binding protein HflX
METNEIRGKQTDKRTDGAFETKTVENRAVLVGLNANNLPDDQNASEDTLAELEALLQTAGGVCVGTVLQNRQSPDPHSFIGEGKVQEVKELAEAQGAELVIFDNELSPSQLRVLTEASGVQVMDRAGLILDIFAKRAKTREGRLQVELAQYQYLLPRLTGMWGHLVRQTASGGKSPIGTRGPGETQLETDRRHIRRKIQKLQEDLEAVRRVRAVQRARRTKNEIPVVALVGYTNAGKSTLLNRLTDAGIPANDRLFDTLDTTTRTLPISETCTVLLSDTVGFIRKLPHHLVDAFKATLEELSYADLLLHIIDASNPQWREQAEVVETLIRELGAEGTRRIDVFNKADVFSGDIRPHGGDIVSLSAKTGEGVDELLAMIGARLDAGYHRLELRIPYENGGVLDMLYRDAKVERVAYEDCILVTALCTEKILGQVKPFCGAEPAPEEEP